MAITLTLSLSLSSSEQSAIRQTVACWSVAIGGGTDPQDVFPGREGKGGRGGGGAGYVCMCSEPLNYKLVMDAEVHYSNCYSEWFLLLGMSK